MMRDKILGAFILICLFFFTSPKALAGPPRVLKFSGVPISQAGAIKKKFPFVFEREVSLAEVDDIVRFLMKTGSYSNIEVIERDSSDGSRELVLVASILRRIREIKIQGNKAISSSDIAELLDISKGKTFERKDLLAASDELRRIFEQKGYTSSKVEIEFQLPSDSEVDINVLITEGTPVRIVDANVETNNLALSKQLSRLARKLKGKVLTEDELLDFQKDLNQHLINNRFLTARIANPVVTLNEDQTQAKISYILENPWRLQFLIEGNQHFNEFDILRFMELDKLAGSTSSPAPDLADRIRRAYQNAGFVQAEVTYKDSLNDETFTQTIKINIHEGYRVRIKEMQISGNISRPPSYYREYINGTGATVFTKGFYNRKEIEDSTKRLIVELQNQGYLRAKIQSSRAEFSTDNTSVILFIALDEGPLTQIRQIKLEGADSFPKTDLLQVLSIRSGAALSLKDLEESITNLKNFYRSNGYLEMRLLNENEQSRIVTYNDTNTQATVEFQISEGPKITVGAISIQGNSFTKEHVIQRELTFKAGDTLTPEKVESSIFHLQRLGLFSRVNIRTLEEGTSIAERTAIVEIGERDPGLFTMGLGVNNEQDITFRGYLGVAYRNLNGTGRAVSFRIDPKYSTDPRISFVENKVALSYLEPYIFGDRNRGRVNLTREQAYLASESQTRPVILEENSIGLLLERDLTRHVKLTYTGYNFSNQRKFDRATFDTIDTQNIAKTGPLVEIDYRDDIFNPTKGTYSFLSAEYSDPAIGSSDDSKQTIQFFKSTAGITHYARLSQRSDLIWTNSIRAGYLANMSSSSKSGVPSQEAFFLGGRSTIRGFDTGGNERIPSMEDLSRTDLLDFKVTTDSYYYLVKTELRIPISGPFGIAGFYDGGAVYITQPDVRITDPYRDAAGVGLRVSTPVGPVSFDLAWKLDKRPKETPFVLHFSIGIF